MTLRAVPLGQIEAARIAIAAIAPWQAGCNDYYRAFNGRVVTQWPRSMPAMERVLAGLDEEAYEAHART